MKLPRFLRLYYRRAQRVQGSVDSLAFSAAMGAAIACTPTMPLHTCITIVLALLLRVNVVVALLSGTLISNPLTVVPQYYLLWKIGSFFFPDQLSWQQIKNTLYRIEEQGFFANLEALGNTGWTTIKVMLTGSLILSIPIGLLTYFLARYFFSRVRQKPRRDQLLKVGE